MRSAVSLILPDYLSLCLRQWRREGNIQLARIGAGSFGDKLWLTKTRLMIPLQCSSKSEICTSAKVASEHE